MREGFDGLELGDGEERVLFMSENQEKCQQSRDPGGIL